MFHLHFVIFCNSNFGWMGLGYLSTAVKKIEGIRVSAAYYNPQDIDKACSETVLLNPDVIGLPLLQTNLKAAMEFVKKAKPLIPETHFTLGNKEATAQPELLMKRFPGVDSVIIGEGEYTLMELITRLKKGRSLESFPGIFYRKGNEIVKNDMRALEKDIENFGVPDRSILPIDRPCIIANECQKVFPVFTSRGCRGRCSFCGLERGGRRVVRSRLMDKVFDEIEMLVKDYGATYILFGDDSFEDGGNDAVERFKQLASTIKKRGINIRFFLSCRAETLDLNVVDLLRELTGLGLDRIFIGIEAGNEADLKLYNKRASLSENIQAMELLSDLQISVIVGFIMFNPYSTFQRLKKNSDFLKRFGLYTESRIMSTRLAVFNGTPLTKIIARDGLLENNVEFPIDEEFSYRFMDVRIEQAWAVLNTLGEIPASADEISNTYSLGFWLSNPQSPYRCDAVAMQFARMLDDYKRESNQLLDSLFRRVIDLAESGKTSISNLPGNNFTDIKRALGQSWDKIAILKEIIQLRLKKAGVFPIKNHCFSSLSPSKVL